MWYQMADPKSGNTRLASPGQDQQHQLQRDMLEAQQDTNALLRDLIGEIKTLRSVMENGNG